MKPNISVEQCRYTGFLEKKVSRLNELLIGILLKIQLKAILFFQNSIKSDTFFPETL